MAIEKTPSDRARAFQTWMRQRGHSTNSVSKKSGVPYTTLASFVQGDTRSLRGAAEEKIAQAYETSTDAIFSAAALGRAVRIIGRVAANPESEVLMAQADERYDYVEPPPGATSASVALEVNGHSMRGFADDGSLIYFEDQRTPPTPDLLGEVVVAETVEGRVLVKRLLRGSGPDLFDLESANGPTLKDQRLRWAAEITAVIPPRQARRIILRSGEAA